MSNRAKDYRARPRPVPGFLPPEWEDEGPEVFVAEDAQLIEENKALRTQVVAVEARNRMLQTTQADLRKVHLNTTRHAAQLQAECNRLATENRQLQQLAEHPGGPSGAAGRSATGRGPTVRHQEARFMKFVSILKGVVTSRWGLPAVAVAVLMARDPAVRGLASSAAERLGAVSPGAADTDPAAGYLGFARLVNARAAYEAARASYNAKAESLKGDALLEAQDALRAAKARYAQARAAFVPALRDACTRADVPFPGQADALAGEAKADTGE
jgi:hypothetical protein